MDHPYPSMKYVDANHLDDKTVKFAGMEVDGVDGEKLGNVEGFILDVNAIRPYHVVVGSGHLFKHKHFLLPIGHVSLDETGTKLEADVAKDRVERFPGFDKREFEKLSADDLKQLAERMAAACCPADVVVVTAWETAGHYRHPDWWDANVYRPERMATTDEVGMTGDPGR
jgi:hypothetical protein